MQNMLKMHAISSYNINMDVIQIILVGLKCSLEGWIYKIVYLLLKKTWITRGDLFYFVSNIR